jgi:hypothetical protein
MKLMLSSRRLVAIGVYFAVSYGAAWGADLVTLRGPALAAANVAIADFKKLNPKADLRHYSVELIRHGKDLEVTLIPDLPAHFPPGRAGTGGETVYGPSMTYVVSIERLKILRFNFHR